MQLNDFIIALLTLQKERGLTGMEQVTFSRDCVASTAMPETGADLIIASAVHAVTFTDGETVVYLMDAERCDALLLREKLQRGNRG